MPWLGIILAPFGSGKTTHREFFATQLPGGGARVFSVDDYVYRSPSYQKALARADRAAMRRIYLREVHAAREAYDRDVAAAILVAPSSAVPTPS